MKRLSDTIHNHLTMAFSDTLEGRTTRTSLTFQHEGKRYSLKIADLSAELGHQIKRRPARANELRTLFARQRRVIDGTDPCTRGYHSYLGARCMYCRTQK